jgi:DNA mismatch repair protein MutL
MNPIRVLEPQIVDRIAAGEVVERPASVVKELVENSLDAGATRITVRIEGGGARLIEVIDDGHGMTRADAELAFTQHATSKIRTAVDLDRIMTLGFRGEALASVAAVSEVELLTGTGAGAGVRVRVSGAKLLSIEDAAAPAGTRLAVRELFFNTPARLKHLRTERTEAGRVSGVVEDFALLRPDVHFRLVQDGQDRLVAPPVDDLAQRVHQVLGADVATAWMPLEEIGSHVTVRGGLTRPDENRASRAHVHLFVNGRAIADGRLVHAVTSGYDATLPRGRYPLAAIFLSLDPGDVDVNVHPRKAEVRFVEPGAVYGTLRRAVARAVAAHEGPPELRPQPSLSAAGVVRESPSLPAAPRRTLPLQDWQSTSGSPGRAPEVAAADEVLHTRGAIQPLSQFANTYILAADEEGLLVIDQHVAHERILFERIRAQRATERVRVQRLLVPEIVELSASEAAAAEEHAAALTAFGFELEPFGGKDWALRGVPEILGQRGGGDMVRSLLDSLASHTGTGAADAMERDIAASIACHSAVRANQPLTPEAMSRLLADLAACSEPMRCPHGRPVMLRMTLAEIEREIGRH